MSRKFNVLLFAATALGGCNSLPEPGYDPPDQDDAIAAYKAANTVDADILESLDAGHTSDLPGIYYVVAPGWAAGWDTFQRVTLISTLRGNNKVYDEVIPGNCEWQFVDPELVRKSSQPRVAGEPFPAWLCDAEVLITQQHNIKAKYTARGYFYLTEQGWLFAGDQTSDITRDRERMRKPAAQPTGSFSDDEPLSSDWGA